MYISDKRESRADDYQRNSKSSGPIEKNCLIFMQSERKILLKGAATTVTKKSGE